MKVYSDFKGAYIRINKPSWIAGTEFMVHETENSMELIKLEANKNE